MLSGNAAKLYIYRRLCHNNRKNGFQQISFGDEKMKDNWEKMLSCAIQCEKCGNELDPTDQRILSAYDHQPICMACKREEEDRPDYAEVSKDMIGQCLAESEILYSDPGGYCFYHFYPFKC